jgi:hypothetical protein
MEENTSLTNPDWWCYLDSDGKQSELTYITQMFVQYQEGCIDGATLIFLKNVVEN